MTFKEFKAIADKNEIYSIVIDDNEYDNKELILSCYYDDFLVTFVDIYSDIRYDDDTTKISIVSGFRVHIMEPI